MSTRLKQVMRTVLVLLPAVPGCVFSQADSQTAAALPPVAVPPARPLPPGPSAYRGVHEYQLSSIYDRVADRTRVTVVPSQHYQLTFGKPTMSFAASIGYPGHGAVTSQDSVELEFITFTPARSGWGLAHAQPLRITLDDSVHMALPAAGYQRMSVRLLDRGRREIVRFWMPTAEFRRLAASARAKLKVGRFTIKLKQQDLEGLLALNSRLVPAGE